MYVCGQNWSLQVDRIGRELTHTSGEGGRVVSGNSGCEIGETTEWLVSVESVRIIRMGDSLRASLLLNISSVLPHLAEEKNNSLIDVLLSKGVKKERDLRFISVSILEEALADFIDASELHQEWQKKFGSSNVDSTSATHTNPGPSSRPLIENVSSRSRLRGGAVVQSASVSTMPTFEDHESPYFPSAVKQAIKDQKRPSAKAREGMVERIVDHCKEVVPNLERAMFNAVALDIVIRWPKTFKDTLPQSEHGHDSLAKQMRDKFDNDKRPKVLTTTEKAAPANKEAFGCILWSPELPEGVTEESLEEKRVAMERMHQLSRKEWDWKFIKCNIQDSFYLQRKEINGKKPEEIRGRKRSRQVMETEADEDTVNTSDPQVLKIRWPYLFTSKGMNYHFKKLTGTDLKDNLPKFIREESTVLIEYMSTKNKELAKLKRAMVRADKNLAGGTGSLSIKVAALMIMLVEYLDNDLSYLVRFVESTTSFEEVEDSVDFPLEKTPIIIAAGTTLYDSSKYFVCVDGKPMMATSNLGDAFCAFFSVFFVLSIEYTDKLSAFLLYVQRVIGEISPQKGTKCSNAALHRTALSKANKLHNKFAEYKQQMEEEENNP